MHPLRLLAISTTVLAIALLLQFVNLNLFPFTSASAKLKELSHLTGTMGNSANKSSVASAEVEQTVQDAIANNPVVIFSKTYCPYCVSAKSDLATAARSVAAMSAPKVFELDTMGKKGRAIQAYLALSTGRRTVPNVFIGGKTVGGGDDIAGYARRGVLKQMLAQACSAIAPETEETSQSSSGPKKLVEDAISTNPVVIFSKTYCPYCVTAKRHIADSADRMESFDGAKIFELDTMGEEGWAIQGALEEMTGRRTVPNVFISGKSVGGGDDVAGIAASGNLDDMISRAVAELKSPEVDDESKPKEFSAKDLVEDAIAKHPVAFFSKTFCPHCKKAKALMAETGKSVSGYLPPKFVEIDIMGEEGEAIQKYLLEKTGQRTVPNIFIGGKHIGGGTDLRAVADKGELAAMITEAHAAISQAVAEPFSAKDLVEDAIAEHPVAFFSKTFCPHCKKAKALMAETGKSVSGYLPPKFVEIDIMGEEGEAIQKYLLEKTGQRTVPNIFIGGKHIGGGTDLRAVADKGELAAMITEAHASISKTAAAQSEPSGPILKEIVFGAGCFWGVELAFQRVPGVMKTEVGYSNGRVARVTYDAICSGLTGATEVVRVSYNPAIVSLSELIKVWEGRHDPTSLNKQGNDAGTQYRSAIYYFDDEQKAEIGIWNTEASGRYNKEIVSEIVAVNNYCTAEEPHQRYLEKKGQSAEKGSNAPIRCYG